MGSGDSCCTLCGFCCLFGISLFLQGIGIFSPRWVTTDNNSTGLDECHLGLVISACDDGEGINKAVLGLEATSFTIILFTNIALFCSSCGNKDEDDDSLGICGCCVGCCGLLYPIAGLMTLIGCIVSATEYSTFAVWMVILSVYCRRMLYYTRGSSFIWAIFLLHLLENLKLSLSICLCCAICIVAKDDDEDTESRGHDNSVAVTSSSRDLGVAGHRHSIRAVTQETEYHAIATNNGFMYIARQVTRMVHLRSE